MISSRPIQGIISFVLIVLLLVSVNFHKEDFATELIDVKGVEKNIRKIAKETNLNNLKGAVGEVEVAAKLRREGSELIKMSHKLPDGEIDLIYKETSTGQVVIAEIKSGDPKNFELDKLERQLNNYKAQLGKEIEGETIEKVQLISREVMDENMKQTIESWGVKVKNGIDEI